MKGIYTKLFREVFVQLVTDVPWYQHVNERTIYQAGYNFSLLVLMLSKENHQIGRVKLLNSHTIAFMPLSFFENTLRSPTVLPHCRILCSFSLPKFWSWVFFLPVVCKLQFGIKTLMPRAIALRNSSSRLTFCLSYGNQFHKVTNHTSCAPSSASLLRQVSRE